MALFLIPSPCSHLCFSLSFNTGGAYGRTARHQDQEKTEGKKEVFDLAASVAILPARQGLCPQPGLYQFAAMARVCKRGHVANYLRAA